MRLVTNGLLNISRSSQNILVLWQDRHNISFYMARSSQKTILQWQDRHTKSFYYWKIVTKHPFTLGRSSQKILLLLGRSSQNNLLLWEDRHKTSLYYWKIVTSGKTVTTPFHTVAKLSQFSDVVIVIRHVLGLLQKGSSCRYTGCQAMWCLCWDMVILLAMV